MAAMGNLPKDIRKGREDRSLYLRGILPYLFALGCARAWVTLAVAAPVFAAVGVLIPLASMHRMQRNSVVDRLREE